MNAKNLQKHYYYFNQVNSSFVDELLLLIDEYFKKDWQFIPFDLISDDLEKLNNMSILRAYKKNSEQILLKEQLNKNNEGLLYYIDFSGKNFSYNLLESVFENINSSIKKKRIESKKISKAEQKIGWLLTNQKLLIFITTLISVGLLSVNFLNKYIIIESAKPSLPIKVFNISVLIIQRITMISLYFSFIYIVFIIIRNLFIKLNK